jgi:hypothetical protein
MIKESRLTQKSVTLLKLGHHQNKLDMSSILLYDVKTFLYLILHFGKLVWQPGCGRIKCGGVGYSRDHYRREMR